MGWKMPASTIHAKIRPMARTALCKSAGRCSSFGRNGNGEDWKGVSVADLKVISGWRGLFIVFA